jgi:hypothetical protein
VRRLGITTQKQSPTLTLVVHLFSPNGKYDSLYMRNYATLKVKDELARCPASARSRFLAPANTRCASGWIPTRWRRAG